MTEPINKNFEPDELTRKIIGCCFEVHRLLGPGFVEKIYARALEHQLKLENLSFVAEKEFNVVFKDLFVGKFRCDIFVEGKVIVELKSVTGHIPNLFHGQLLSYLKASNVKTGLLINFGNASCEVKRISV
ncbi:GxxExxY protein [Mucilaginibacter sp. BJC16-A38]|uniref:GxxExxY protein n=1 Tax=Mucilaginibacter phenanthrenivorans TaxID=1234842 RepID=UPI0021571E33|nr:GxxExxY protein [Mucilaginibacter phenanthrenivorans]MCR8559434.1 GxxExxY protein [Mucilaginibacter phenanthrenivorans]